MSDLHLEFGGFEEFVVPDVDRDVLVLAGDIGVGKGALEFIKEQLKLSPVVYILGNHEFYHNEVLEVEKFWKQLDLEDLYVLENSSIVIQNVRFLGCVLWTNFDNHNKEVMELAKSVMNDYRTTTLHGIELAPNDTCRFHQSSINWLQSELTLNQFDKTIVVTHHIPSPSGIHEKYRGDDLNPAFYSDLDELMKSSEPNLWIHGHTHESMNYQIGRTNLICNPRGYFPFDLNEYFVNDLIYEI